MKPILRRVLRWSFVFVVAFAASFLVVAAFQKTEWFKNRMLSLLLTGDDSQRLRAATTLARLGAESQLLEGLKAEVPRVHELARRALEHVWFIQAGDKAYELTQKAYEIAEKERYVEAIDLLDQVIRQHPDFAEAWNRRGSVYWQMGDFENSLRDCRRALQLNPNHYGALQGLGVCELKLGNVPEACRALRGALRIAPHDETTRRCLRQCEELLRTYSGSQSERIQWL